ncbi:MAG TPA: FecR family protein [Burkholderiales bacterium]|nr:FecR family protein [Burkholderiales bacterium]
MLARTLLLLLLAVPAIACAQAGRFLLAVGDVVVARGAAELRAAPGTPVDAGDTVRVGPNSSAQVRFTDESVVSLRAGTVFRVDTYEFAGSGTGRSFFSLVKGGFRTVTGLIGRLHSKERYQVRTATSTIGIRGTHYTVVHCAGDCASGVADGTYGGVSDGRIGVENQAASVEFGANEFFHVATENSAPQSLIRPPEFLYPRPPRPGTATSRSEQGAGGQETVAGTAGAGSESRANEPPVIVTPLGPVVAVIEPVVASAPELGVIGAWAGADGISSTGGAYITKSMVTLNASGQIAAFNIPMGQQGPDEGTAEGGVSGSASVIAQAGSAGATNGVNAFWARWGTGSISEDIGTTTFPGGAHLLVGSLTPADVVGGKTGTLTMTSIGAFGTAPTSTNGGTFSGGSFPVLTVDFTNRLAAFSATALSFSNGDTWSLGATPQAPISIVPGQGAGFKTQASAGCSGTTCGTITGTVQYTGIFYGPVGDHVGVGMSGRAGPSGTVGFNAVRVYCPTC